MTFRNQPTASHAYMTRDGSVAGAVEGLIAASRVSVDAALYRFNNERLARVLGRAAGRGLNVRLVVDRNKYNEDHVTRRLLSSARIPFRPLYGRRGAGSKMHHKFAILDGGSVLTGSYNWTLESEDENYDNLVLLREPAQVEAYRREFEALWREAGEKGS